jgi:hypothetical protein
MMLSVLAFPERNARGLLAVVQFKCALLSSEGKLSHESFDATSWSQESSQTAIVGIKNLVAVF